MVMCKSLCKHHFFFCTNLVINESVTKKKVNVSEKKKNACQLKKEKKYFIILLNRLFLHALFYTTSLRIHTYI